MRWPDLSGERGSSADSGAAADRQRPEPDSLARRLGRLAASHPSSPDYEPASAEEDPDQAADDPQYEDPAYGDPAAALESGAVDPAGEFGDDGGPRRPDEGAGAGVRSRGAGDGAEPYPGGRRSAGGLGAGGKGEPYRPWFSAGEPGEPWFTADPGGSPG
jgi:hypothetical protein